MLTKKELIYFKKVASEENLPAVKEHFSSKRDELGFRLKKIALKDIADTLVLISSIGDELKKQVESVVCFKREQKKEFLSDLDLEENRLKEIYQGIYNSIDPGYIFPLYFESFSSPNSNKIIDKINNKRLSEQKVKDFIVEFNEYQGWLGMYEPGKFPKIKI